MQPAQDDDGLCWLDPDGVAISDDGQGQLNLVIRGRAMAAHAAWAFPASEPRRFISLRSFEPSGRESELGMIRALDDWPENAQEVVCRSLARRYFLQRIRAIRQIHTQGNQLVLLALTDRGAIRLQLEKPGDGYQTFGKDGLLLADSRGNYFLFPSRSELSKRQQRLLSLYLGD